MARENQTTRHKSLMASIEEASGFHSPGSKLFEIQSVSSTESALYLEMLGRTLEDTSGYPTPEFPERAPVRFDSSPMLQDFNSLAALSVFVTKADRTPQSLAAAVETLVSIISENEDELFASLAAEDYQRLTVTRDKLIDVIDEDENHLLVPLLAFIDNLIKNHDGESNPSIREHYRPMRRSERVGRPEKRPRVKLADLLPQESETIADIQEIDAAALKPRRSERVGRPEKRPRVKLADLLAREAEHIVAEERDTETPASSEAW